MHYVDNTVAMWRGYSSRTETMPGYTRFESPPFTRIVLHQPHESVDHLAANTIEDSWGTSKEPQGVIAKRMAVMDRPASPILGFTSSVAVGPVRDASDLAIAERVIVDGFPLRAFQPWVRGASLPLA